MNQHEYHRSIQLAQEFLTRCFAPGETIAVIASARKTSQRDAESRPARTCRCTSLSGLARAPERGRSQHLCCCQSASPWQLGNAPKRASPRCGIYTWILILMARPSSLRSGPRIGFPIRPRSSQHRRANIRCSGVWKASISRAGKHSQVARFRFRWRSRLHRLQPGSPCAWIPEPEVRSRPPRHGPISAIPTLRVPSDFRLDIAATNPMMFEPHIPPREASGQAESIRNTIGHGFCTNLPRGKDAVKLTRNWLRRRSDKPNPSLLRAATVDVASARLWLMEGIPIET